MIYLFSVYQKPFLRPFSSVPPLLDLFFKYSTRFDIPLHLSMYRNGNRLNLRSVYWIYNVSLGNIRHQHKNLCQQSPKPDNSKPETMSNIPRTTSESEQSTHEENEAMSDRKSVV